MTILNAYVAPDVGLLAVDGEVRGRTLGKIFPLPHLSAAISFRGSTGPSGRIALFAHQRGLEFDKLAAALPEVCAKEQRTAIAEGDLIAPRGLEAVLVGFSPQRDRVVGLRVGNCGRLKLAKSPDAPFSSTEIHDWWITVPVAPDELLKPRTVDEMFALGCSQIANGRRLMRGTEGEAHMPGFPFVVAEIKRDCLNLHVTRGA